LALRKLLAPYLRKRGIYQGGPALIKPQRSLNDPSAKAAAIHTVKHLKHHGYVFEPDLVHSWAVTRRWKSDDAQQLSVYAAGAGSGKRDHSRPGSDWKAGDQPMEIASRISPDLTEAPPTLA
jgi:hypothetical protein